MKTIKQIANGLGLDKQRVYRYIRKNHISEAHQDAGVMYYDEAAEMLIKRHFSGNRASGESHQTASNDAVIDAVISMLQDELQVKNQQIRELNARLAESNTALVVAQRSAQAAQALHAGTMKNQLTDGEVAYKDGGKSKGFWERLFSKKRNGE